MSCIPYAKRMECVRSQNLQQLVGIICSFCLMVWMGITLPLPIYAATDPVAHWKFDDGSGTAPVDSSGNNITGSFLSPNPTWSTDVPASITFSDPYSLDFSGSHDGVTFSWPSGLNFAQTAPRSFSFWYKPTGDGENDAGSYDRIISWTSDAFEIAGTMGNPAVHRVTFYDGSWRDTGYDLTVGTWYHLTFTYDGTTVKLYVDNDVKFSGSSGGRALSGTLAIGTRENGHNEGINGRIDDVRVYDYALTLTQVENLTAGSNNPDSTPTPSTTPTPTPSPTSTPSPATTSSATSSPVSSPCDPSTQRPTAPDLFQISTAPSKATLYFTPVAQASGYIISYGLTSDANQYSVEFEYSDRSGTIPYTIQDLSKESTYYFKVRGKNNCAGGGVWSVARSEKTTGEVIASYVPKISTGTMAIKKTQSILEQTPAPSESPTPSPNHPTEKRPEGYDLSIAVVNNGEPVVGAKVELHSVPRQTITDSHGIARFANVEAGTHRVLLAYQGFNGEEHITLEGEKKEVSVNLSVSMKPDQNYFSKSAVWVITLLILLVLCLTFVILKKKKKAPTKLPSRFSGVGSLRKK